MADDGDSFMNRLPNLRGIFNDFRTAIANRGQNNAGRNIQIPLGLQERINRMAEQNNNGNPREPIFITDMLKAYPVEKTNSNKIVLPHSLLEEIHNKKVWDNRPAGKPLIFELSVADPDTGDVIEETHVGVDDFTAPPGKIGLPYKTALSLTKERGVGWLKEHPLVFLRYVEIQTTPETTMSIQPRGKGFHNDDQSVVQLDIKSLLEKTLKNHFVLTNGDWIPLFHDGKKFELVVKDLKPDDIIDVLNTDLTVEILPSEETSGEIDARKQASEQYEEFMKNRDVRYKEKISKLEKSPEPPKEKKEEYVMVRVKLPKGGSPRRRFAVSAQYGLVMDWVETELYKSEFLPKVLPTPELEYWFKLASALPGKKKTPFSNSDAWKTLEQVLEEKNMKQTQGLALIVEMVKASGAPEDGEEEEDEDRSYNDNMNNEWLRMAARLEQNIEKELEDEAREAAEALTEAEIVEIGEKIQTYGIDEGIANEVARMYGKQVRELEAMGYSADKIAIAIPLLQDKRGNLSAVLEIMMAADIE